MVYSCEVCGLREVLLRRVVQIFAHLFDVQLFAGASFTVLREVLLRRAVQIFAHLFDVQVLVGVGLRGVEEGP